MRNWEEEDEPLYEHAKWFPNCGYIRTLLGDDYVETIKSKYPMQHTNHPITGPLSQKGKQAINNRMESANTLAILEMGFDKNRVYKVIEDHYRKTGGNLLNKHTLLANILLHDAEDQSQSSQMVPSVGHPPGAPAAPIPPFHEDSPICAARKPSPPNLEYSISCCSKSLGSEEPSGVVKKLKKKHNQASETSKEDETTDTPGTQDKKEVEKGKVDINAGIPPALDSERLYLLKENTELKEQRLCKVCMDKEVNTVFLPCGHLVCCAACSTSLRDCAVCRTLIRGTVRTYLS